jgi:hypothetical protein
MAATYVTEAELRSALGIGALYSSAVVEEVCQAAENVVKSKLWFNDYAVVAHESTTSVAKIYTSVPHDFIVGQTITVENCGAKYNGSKTVTTTGEFWVTYAVNNATAEVYNALVPWGKVYGTTHIDYETFPEVNQATLMIAVDIWQARQASNAGGISPDFQPSPYRMGNTLMARVRGLLADHLAPGGQVG